MSTCMRAAVALCMFWLRLRYYLHNSICCKITGPASCFSAAGTPNFYPAVGMYEGCPLVYVLIPDMTLSLFHNWICRKMTGPASCFSTAGLPKFLSGCRHAWQLPLFGVYTCWLRILMIWCQTTASPLPLHWRCCGLALDHPCDVLYAVTQIQSYHYGMCVLIPNTIVLSLHNSTCCKKKKKKMKKIIITVPASCFSTAGSPKFLSYFVYTCVTLMGCCRTAVSPLPLHWRCCSLALDLWFQMQLYHCGMCVCRITIQLYHYFTTQFAVKSWGQLHAFQQPGHQNLYLAVGMYEGLTLFCVCTECEYFLPHYSTTTLFFSLLLLFLFLTSICWLHIWVFFCFFYYYYYSFATIYFIHSCTKMLSD